ncbi:hypothetical protein A5689_17440 [Mycobacterium intracellulare subsp. yongonense]|nr:hypothetical protein A5689_17440 [Mycobacterium intracellulare subsp. yongonense]
MQQTAIVRVVKCARHRRDDLGDVVRRHAVLEFVVEQACRVEAVNIVHRNPQLAVVLASVVHTDDVGVPQG